MLCQGVDPITRDVQHTGVHGVEELVALGDLREAVDGPLNEVAGSVRGAEGLVVGLDGQEHEADAVVEQAVEGSEARLMHADGEVLEPNHGLTNHLKAGTRHHVGEATVIGREAIREAGILHDPERGAGPRGRGGQQWADCLESRVVSATPDMVVVQAGVGPGQL